MTIPNASTAPKQLTELEGIIEQLIAEHRKMLAHVDAARAAMRSLDTKALDAATNQQEAVRLRIAAAEQKRRALTQQVARSVRLTGEPKLSQLADSFPQRRERLLSLRRDLQSVLADLSRRSQIAGRVAGSMLGHLNTAVRLLTGSARQAGLYTRTGTPQHARRIGTMNTVG